MHASRRRRCTAACSTRSSTTCAPAGVSARLLGGRGEDPFGSALALRFLGAVHRIVLDGRAPALAAHYPSAGGARGPGPGGDVPGDGRGARGRDRRAASRTACRPTRWVARPCWSAGTRRSPTAPSLPLRVLEVGASAGLNLRWDHFAYDTGRVVCGDPDSPVRFAGVWEGDPPDLPPRFEVAERRGCDRNPHRRHHPRGSPHARCRTCGPTRWSASPASRRPSRWRGGCRPPSIEPTPTRGSPIASRSRCPGVATVVVHSIVLQYLPEGRAGPAPRGDPRRRRAGLGRVTAGLAAHGAGRRAGRAAAHHLAARRGARARHRRLPRQPDLVGRHRRLTAAHQPVAAPDRARGSAAPASIPSAPRTITWA